MLKLNIKAVQGIMLGTIVFLAGCNAQPAQPTLDPNMIYTAAAQTVQAQMAVASAGTATAAAAAPTSTATPEAPAAGPTLLATVPPGGPSPTFTMGATLSINLTPGVTAAAPVGAGTPTASILIVTQQPVAIATLPPTASAVAPVITGDKGAYVDQNPDDGTLVTKNYDFDETWKIKNVGTTTWTTTDYYIADMTNSDQLAKKTWYFLKNDVAPNNIALLVVDMRSPGTSGQYKSSWCLINKANPSRCISIFDVTINVN